MITEHHGNISEFRLNPKEFDDVLHAAYNKLYELYENEDE